MTRSGEESDASPALTVDARGMRCPWPVLRAARAMRETDRFILLADDPVARKDVPDLATLRGWTCETEEADGTTRFLLARTSADELADR